MVVFITVQYITISSYTLTPGFKIMPLNGAHIPGFTQIKSTAFEVSSDFFTIGCYVPILTYMLGVVKTHSSSNCCTNLGTSQRQRQSYVLRLDNKFNHI